jgi:NADH pyrophosphatase NudC (nudix superfamily)
MTPFIQSLYENQVGLGFDMSKLRNCFDNDDADLCRCGEAWEYGITPSMRTRRCPECGEIEFMSNGEWQTI